jgi:CDP-diacylglycerol--glycerol-3-phosphate 3-phosphatidyltransferase
MGESSDQRDDLIEAWSARHRGLRPSPLVRRWLTLMWTLARPLAEARVPPAAITAAGVLLAVDAPLLAARLPLVALVLVLAAALCDGLDGAVALLQARTTRAGAVADTIADRIADTAFALVIWQAGAPLWLALVAAALSVGLELARRRPLITVAERPTRVICTALACVSAAISDAAWPPTVCAAIWVAATLVAFVQITS